ncbi:MAG: BadF/BadG/BcrA/BcrD ATPase family protein [Paracoccaceae bacterium]
MRFYLGIDGGGSGCRAAVADAGGRILAMGAAGPANIASDPEAALANILAAASAAAAGIARIEDLCAGLGLAGANAAGAGDRLARALPFASLRIETDALTATRGALGPQDGIVAAIGTGSVYAVQRKGAIRQIGGRGLAIGDEASGAWLGREAMAMALRACDGMEPATPFLNRLVARHGGPDQAVAWTVGARPADFATLAPEIAASGDPAARALMDRAAGQVNRAIAVLQGADALPVALIGGLTPVYAPRMAGRWRLIPPQGTALDGALLLARGVAG